MEERSRMTRNNLRFLFATFFFCSLASTPAHTGKCGSEACSSGTAGRQTISEEDEMQHND